jgi:UDP-2-acetamido-3-amino-2,3-dideoxy-glucuronate N-acetyltransferase
MRRAGALTERHDGLMSTETLTYFAHPSAIVDAGAEIGEGTKIWHFCHVMPGARIGQRCSFGQNVVIMPGVVIGNNVKLQTNIMVCTGVFLEDDVFVGPSVVFTNVTTPRSHVPRRDAYVETRVGKGASLGGNATLVCGHSIGRYALVGAGAVVTRDVPNYALVVGNPARVTGWVCQCGVKLAGARPAQSRLTCTACGDTYRFENGALAPEVSVTPEASIEVK